MLGVAVVVMKRDDCLPMTFSGNLKKKSTKILFGFLRRWYQNIVEQCFFNFLVSLAMFYIFHNLLYINYKICNFWMFMEKITFMRFWIYSKFMKYFEFIISLKGDNKYSMKLNPTTF